MSLPPPPAALLCLCDSEPAVAAYMQALWAEQKRLAERELGQEQALQQAMQQQQVAEGGGGGG